MRSLLSILVLFFLGGCDNIQEPISGDVIVLEGYVVSGSPVEWVKVTRAVTPFEIQGGQSEISIPVSGAQVSLVVDSNAHVLVEDTSTIPNRFPPKTNHGTYRPASTDSIAVFPGNEVVLSVLWNGRLVESRTTVPQQIAIIGAPDTISTEASQFVVRVGPASPSGGFIVVAKIDHQQPINPSYNGYNFFITSETDILIPLSTLYNVGINTIHVYAIDKNYFEYLRTRKSGNPTQTLFQPSNSVEGGVGVFGSATVDSISIFVR